MVKNNLENNSKQNRFGRASLRYMLVTEYLWMYTCESITVGGLLLTRVPIFRSDL